MWRAPIGKYHQRNIYYNGIIIKISSFLGNSLSGQSSEIKWEALKVPSGIDFHTYQASRTVQVGSEVEISLIFHRSSTYCSSDLVLWLQQQLGQVRYKNLHVEQRGSVRPQWFIFFGRTKGLRNRGRVSYIPNLDFLPRKFGIPLPLCNVNKSNLRLLFQGRLPRYAYNISNF